VELECLGPSDNHTSKRKPLIYTPILAVTRSNLSTKRTGPLGALIGAIVGGLVTGEGGITALLGAAEGVALGGMPEDGSSTGYNLFRL